MKKVLTAAIATSLATGSAFAGANLGMDFASAHVFRGATVVDDFVVQPTVELDGFGMPAEYGEFVLGAWASAAPFGNDSVSTPYETDWYLTYMLPTFAEDLDLSVSLTEYTYSAVPNERELNLVAGYALGDAFYLAASFNYMLYNQFGDATEGQIYIPFSVDWEMEISEGFTGGAGALISFLMAGDGNAAAGQDDGLNDYEIYGTLGYDLNDMWAIGASLTYIGQGDDQVLSDAAYDVSLVGMLGVTCEM
jgi:hypothetical protein